MWIDRRSTIVLYVEGKIFFFLINTLEWKKAEDRDEVFGKESDNVNWHVVYGDEGYE